jgi:hypothetical protein
VRARGGRAAAVNSAPAIGSAFRSITRPRTTSDGRGASFALAVGSALGKSVWAKTGCTRSSDLPERFDFAVDLTAIPRPMGFVAGLPGDSRNFQLWYRNPNSAGAALSNLSDALSIVLR